MRVLVCGGRDFNGGWLLHDTLADLDPQPTLIIEGEASGADELAKRWAKWRGIPVLPFPAAWHDIHRPGACVRRRSDGVLYDAAAGGVRNQRMLDEGKPDLVVAFPGGRGTADMVARARKAGVRVLEVS